MVEKSPVDSEDLESLDKFVAAAHYLNDKHPKCVDILHILGPGGEYNFSEIEKRIKEDPTRCLQFLCIGKLARNNNNTYEITEQGITLLNALTFDYIPISKYSEFR